MFKSHLRSRMSARLVQIKESGSLNQKKSIESTKPQKGQDSVISVKRRNTSPTISSSKQTRVSTKDATSSRQDSDSDFNIKTVRTRLSIQRHNNFEIDYKKTHKALKKTRVPTSQQCSEDSRYSQPSSLTSNHPEPISYTQRLQELRTNHNILLTTPVFKTLCDSLESLRNATKAAAMSKYMRNKFAYFGIQTPHRRAAYQDLWETVQAMSPEDLRTLTLQTWFSPEREFQYFSTELLAKEVFRLYAEETLSEKERALKTLNFIKTFIEHSSSWWDTVDCLGPNVVGPLVQKYPKELLPEMDKWNLSPCFWVCRASILYQLSYKEKTDADRLFRYCLQAAGEEEFFIRKAIGWALRQYFRTDPVSVKDFVLKHKDTLSPLSVKEALKHDK